MRSLRVVDAVEVVVGIEVSTARIAAATVVAVVVLEGMAAIARSKAPGFELPQAAPGLIAHFVLLEYVR